MTRDANTKAPERIWLQDGGEWSDEAYFAGEITWCDSEVNSNDTEYVRADLLTAAEARAEAAEAERDRPAGLLGARDAYDRGELSQPPHSGRNPATLAKMEKAND